MHDDPYPFAGGLVGITRIVEVNSFPVSTNTLLPVEPVNISRVVSAAAVFNFARHTNAQSWMNADNLSHEVEELFALLEARQVPYLLVGGLAMLSHAKGRNTEDVGLILSVADQSRLGPEVELVDPPEPGSPFALGRYKGLRVDYLDAANPIFGWVLADHSERRTFLFGSGQARELPVASAVGLMLLKVHALPNVTRQMDWERMEVYESDLLRLWLACPEADPRVGVRTLAGHLDEHARYSLEHEVLPDLVRRWERYTGQVAPELPPEQTGQNQGGKGRGGGDSRRR